MEGSAIIRAIDLRLLGWTAKHTVWNVPKQRRPKISVVTAARATACPRDFHGEHTFRSGPIPSERAPKVHVDVSLAALD